MLKTEAQIRESLDSVIEDVETNKRIYGWFAGNVGEIARAAKDLSATMERRFDQVDERFAQVDERFAQVDRRFDKVDTEIGLLQDSVRKMDARLEQLVGYIIRDEKQDDQKDKQRR